jgi:hypothetical protein
MKVVHCKKVPYNIYIGRPTVYGNPFVIGKDGNREEVIRKFEEYARNNFISLLHKDAILGCWCAPEMCHGDVIIKLWKEINEQKS